MSASVSLAHVPASPSGRLPGLDVLRGVAALCVLALHLQSVFGLGPKVFAKGYLAVDLFFMLSGYVMARTYEPRLARGLSPFAFFLARYRRLWPIMAVGTLIGLPKLLSEAASLGSFSATAALNLALLPFPGGGPGFPPNIPAWSICFELAANLLHGLVLWRLSGRWLLALAAVAVPFAAWVGVAYGTLDVGAHSDDFFAGLARISLSYLLGVALYRLWRDRPTVAVSPVLAFVAMPAVFASAWLLGADDWPTDLAFIVVACPLLIAGGLRYDAHQGRGAAIAAALGALSFPLYAVHMPVLQGMRLLGFGPVGATIIGLATGIALTLTVETVVRQSRQRRRALA
jgi:peptidoglycan/LPS O-acetylase OafA/YrhL